MAVDRAAIDAGAARLPGKARSIAVLCLCAVATLSLWFSTTAVIPALVRAYGPSPGVLSMLTGAVQAGFVVGCLVSAALALADRLDPRRFFAGAALVGAAANLAVLFLVPSWGVVIALRFATGLCMAGVYPVGMKLAASWARGDRGLLVGLLVGAVTVGSALPHLINALGGLDWRITLAVGSALAAGAAAAIGLVRIGPGYGRSAAIRPVALAAAWRNVPLRLANLGYLGHMWELYAMWAWIGAFLYASFSRTLGPEIAPGAAALTAFAVIASGGVGCLAAGLAADRWGRTAVTIAAMTVSGACALGIGFLFGGAAWAIVLVALVWGVSVVADSAQFSAAVSELSDPDYVGTMLTLQTAMGFTLTLVTIHLVPVWVEAVGWTYALAPLAAGPLVGVWAMARLRARPEAARLAGGRR
ncbi:MAG: MFS transporter [Azospirillaceae bacterium]